jgi:hypothetical protein
MLVIPPPAKVILCTVPKAANSSIKMAYFHGLEGTQVPDEIECALGYVRSWKENNRSWIYSVDELRALLLHGYHTVGFVRHPLSRMVSCWGDKLEKASAQGTRMRQRYRWPAALPFREFVRMAVQIEPAEADIHFRPQYMFLEGLAKEVVRIEDFATEWPKLQARYPLADIPVTHTSKPRDWREMYDEETHKLASEYYQRDFYLYGYTPD